MNLCSIVILDLFTRGLYCSILSSFFSTSKAAKLLCFFIAGTFLKLVLYLFTKQLASSQHNIFCIMSINFSSQIKFLCRDYLSLVSPILQLRKKKFFKAVEVKEDLEPHIIIVFLLLSSFFFNPLK